MVSGDKLSTVSKLMQAEESTTLGRLIIRYGFALTKKQVMCLINCGYTKLNALIKKGILQTTFDGSRISADSLAAYIDGGPARVEHQNRMAHKYPGVTNL